MCVCGRRRMSSKSDFYFMKKKKRAPTWQYVRIKIYVKTFWSSIEIIHQCLPRGLLVKLWFKHSKWNSQRKWNRQKSNKTKEKRRKQELRCLFERFLHNLCIKYYYLWCIVICCLFHHQNIFFCAIRCSSSIESKKRRKLMKWKLFVHTFSSLWAY